jgi:hypothetical protein
LGNLFPSIVGLLGLLGNGFPNYLYRETLPATTSTSSIRVLEIETLAFQSTRKLQRGIKKVEETFQVGDDLGVVVLENLVIRLGLVVEVHVIAQARTASAGYADPDEIIFSEPLLLLDLLYALFGAFGYEKHDAKYLI